MGRHALLLLLLGGWAGWAAVVPAGCSGGGDDEGGGRPGPGAQDGGVDASGDFPAGDRFALQPYCTAIAAAACRLQQDCDSSLLFNRLADADRCLETAWEACAVEALVAERAVAQGAAGYSGRAAQACLAALEPLGCVERVHAWGLDRCLEQLSDPQACSRFLLGDSPLAACQAIFQGRLAAGSPCRHALECRPGTRCLAAGGTLCPGSCAEELGLSATCPPGRKQCATGLDCAGTPARCAPWAEEGEACTTRGEAMPYARCRPPLTCLITSYEAYGTCRPKKGENEGCGDENGRCRPDLHCRRKSVAAFEGWCSPQLARGERCDVELSEPPGPCALGHLCYGPARKDGQPYSGGTCQPIPEVGEPCARYVDGCLDGWCAFTGDQDRTGICRPFKETGEGCSFAAQCASGVCLTVCTGGEEQACLRPQ